MTQAFSTRTQVLASRTIAHVLDEILLHPVDSSWYYDNWFDLDYDIPENHEDEVEISEIQEAVRSVIDSLNSLADTLESTE